LFDNVGLFAIVELPTHELRELPGNVIALAEGDPSRQSGIGGVPAYRQAGRGTI
jgi:hypothetical protein